MSLEDSCRTCTCSLVVSLLRTLQHLSRRKGLFRLYDGLPADTLSTILSSFLYFFFYSSASKAVLRARGHQNAATNLNPAGLGRSTTKAKPPSLHAWEELLIGLVAGITSKGITLPLSAVSVRQRLGDEDGNDLSLIDTIKTMHAEGGLVGMFSALPASLPLALLPSLTLYIHSALLRLLVPARHRAHPPGQVTFLLGALSNALATIPLYPLILIKALSQSGAGRTEGKGKGKGRHGLVAAGAGIVKQEGIAGLYKGIEGQLLKGLLSQGVMMLVKQR